MLLYGYLAEGDPRGVFIGTRGTGGRGQTLAQNAGAAALVQPRKRSLGRVFAALRWPHARRFEPRAVPSVSCQILVPVSDLQPLILTESAS